MLSKNMCTFFHCVLSVTVVLYGTSMSHRCYETFTGCGLLNASTSSWLCLSIDACMVWRHGIFPTTFRSSLILTAVVSGHRHPCIWLDVHSCPLSVIVRFRWPAAAFGTVCHLMSHELNAHRFPELPQDTTLLKVISCITLNSSSVPTSYTVDSSGLAVFT